MDNLSRFLLILAECESGASAKAWGDGGYACGRYQQHPSFYASWCPSPGEFGGRERSWDWAFDMAVRRFYAACIADKPDASLTRIAMAYHLHGQVRWDGWDSAYLDRWLAAVKVIEARSATGAES